MSHGWWGWPSSMCCACFSLASHPRGTDYRLAISCASVSRTEQNPCALMAVRPGAEYAISKICKCFHRPSQTFHEVFCVEITK